MERKAWIAIGVAAAAGLGAAVWLARPAEPPSEEARIRALFEGAARAAGERKVDEVVEVLSADFEGGGEGRGRATRDDVKRLLFFELMRGQWVSAEILGAEVSVRERQARAVVDAVLSRAAPGGRLSELLPGDYSLHRFDLELALEDGEWRVRSGAWHRIGLEQALSGPDAPDW